MRKTQHCLFFICTVQAFLTHFKTIFNFVQKIKNNANFYQTIFFASAKVFHCIMFLDNIYAFYFLFCCNNFGIVPRIRMRQINAPFETDVLNQTCLQQMHPTTEYQRHSNCSLITFKLSEECIFFKSFLKMTENCYNCPLEIKSIRYSFKCPYH